MSSEIEQNLYPYLPPDPYIPNIPYFGESEDAKKSQCWKLLIITGIVRCGNHLIHSMLDSHSELPRVPGEDPTMLNIYQSIFLDAKNFERRIQNEGAHLLLDYPMGGRRWKKQYEITIERVQVNSQQSWAGKRIKGKEVIFDYQNQGISINYPLYKSKLMARDKQIKTPNRLCDLFYFYLEALQYLDFDYYDEMGQLFFCSGMRYELEYLLNVNPNAKAIVALRRFDGFLSSFIKLRFQDSIDDYCMDNLYIAWGHWSSKMAHYLMLKYKFPNRILLVDFDYILNKPIKMGEIICDVLAIGYSEKLKKATVFGHLVKGNSSFDKSDEYLGEFYHAKKRVPIKDKNIKELSENMWSQATGYFLHNEI